MKSENMEDKTFPKNQVKVKGLPVLFPIVIGFVLIIGTLVTWWLLLKEENSDIEQFTLLQLTSVKDEIPARLEYEALSLLRMARRWEKQGGTPKEAWESDATFYFKHSKGIQAVEWVDSSFHVRWVVPLEGNEAAKDFDLSKEERRRIALEKSRDTGKITLTSSIDLVQGGKGFLAFVPIFKGKDFDGFILGVFRFKVLFENILKSEVPGYSIAIFGNDEEVYRRNVPDNLYVRGWGQETTIDLYGVSWRIRVWPGLAQFAQMRSYIPEWFLVFGILISILLAVMIYLIKEIRLRAKRLDLANRQLEADIYQRKRMEAILEQSRDFHLKLFDDFPTPIWRSGLDAKCDYFNKAWLDFTGRTVEQEMGDGWAEGVHPEDFDRCLKTYLDAFNSHESFQMEYRLRHRDGQYHWVFDMGKPFSDLQGAFAGYIGSCYDITERKRAADEITERMHQSAFTADVGIAMTQCMSLRSALQGCAVAMVKHIDAAFARIWTYNSKENVLELEASAGMYTHIDGAHSRVPFGKFKIGLIAMERMPHQTNSVIGDPRVHDQEWAKREGMIAFAGYPLIVEDNLVGVMAMFSRKQLGDTTLKSLSMVADMIALGIQQKRADEQLRESEERFRTIVETATEAIILADDKGNIISWNKGAQNIFGYSEAEMLGKPITPLMPERYRDAHTKGLERVSLTGESKISRKIMEVYGRRKDGDEFPMEHSVTVWKTGKGIFYTAIIRDITEHKLAEEQIRQSEEKFRQIAEHIKEVFWMAYPDSEEIIYVSPAYEEIWGRTCKSLYENPIDWLNAIYPEDRERIYATPSEEEKSGKSDVEYRIVRPDGSIRWIHDRGFPIKDETGKIYRIVGIAEDITSRKQMEEELHAALLVDELTGMLNRRGFLTMAEQQLKVARRIKRSLFLCFLDLDDLKGINDTLGHKEGDRALVDTAHILKGTLRESDIIARIGGDEFVALAMEVIEDNAGIFMSRLQGNIELHNKEAGRRFKISISLGIVHYNPECPSSLDGLLEQADKLMYEQKREKKK